MNPQRVQVTSRFNVTGVLPPYQAVCTCGWRSEPQDILKDAQVAALLHESKIIRRGYQHETSVEEAR